MIKTAAGIILIGAFFEGDLMHTQTVNYPLTQWMLVSRDSNKVIVTGLEKGKELHMV